MKKLIFGCLLFCLQTVCFGQNQDALCPRHIETPTYPPLARAVRVSGKITLTVTIDADGTVKHVEATPVNPHFNVLQNSAVENMKHWTFAKPQSAPYTQVIVYDYEIDEKLSQAGGTAVTKVSFDLPDHVTILTGQSAINW